MSDLWPCTKRNAAMLTDAGPEPLSSSVSPSVDDKIGPDVVVDTGPLNSASTNIVAEGLEHEQTSASSYLPDMTIPLPGSINDDGTENTDSPVSIIASEDSKERRDDHEGHDETLSGVGKGGGVGQEPPSDTPEMPVFLPEKVYCSKATAVIIRTTRGVRSHCPAR
ncbi:hypothetical protein BDM02DRAFT_2191664 [Thelephora ganbajun]|uniref:Uncharacterized protein n=1 Tax=Thelephora ganbajun TaxID=370292 RepID=A0ACB6ZG93_THEGA|nr:hypothetical protein BDM02DRAFT_2191664 [Thelephora ganbajun]